jgi:hypothetical protein
MKRTLIAGAATMLLAACGGAADAPGKTVQQFMAEDVQPTADIYWGAVRFESVLVDGQPVERDIRPETDEDWARVREAAAKLGEYGTELQRPGYAEGRGEDWMEFAQSLVEVSALAEQAAAQKDIDKVFEVGGTVYSVCKACHDVYPPASGIPGARPGDLETDAAG